MTTEVTTPETPAPAPAPEQKKSPLAKGRDFLRAAWHELRAMMWVLLAVLVFHSFVAKPFYIPSESMMPVLLEGDRLVVSKYPYGYSHVSPTIPNPAAIARNIFGDGPAEPWNITLPRMEGRLFGSVPERGDIVIVTPPGRDEDYIKRVIGLPGDTIAMTGGRLVINGVAVDIERRPEAMIPVDPNAPCGLREFAGHKVRAEDGSLYCRLPIIRETLPNGVSYDTIDLYANGVADEFDPITIPEDHLWLMGDNRDRSSDSRFALIEGGLGGPVPIENIGGRAEMITFSLDGSASLNPLTWWQSLRDGRSWVSLGSDTETE